MYAFAENKTIIDKYDYDNFTNPKYKEAETIRLKDIQLKIEPIKVLYLFFPNLRKLKD